MENENVTNKDLNEEIESLESDDEIKEEKENKKDKWKNNKKDEIKTLKEEVALLKEQLKNAMDETLKAKAESINYRKRKDEEVAQYLKYASSDLINSLLLVADNFERALMVKDEDVSSEVKNFLSGFRMIYQSFMEILGNNGVKEIEALNKTFDSKLHNCLFTENNSDIENDIVTEVISKGYTYHDKILRCASVKVNINNKNDDKNNENIEKEDDKNE